MPLNFNQEPYFDDFSEDKSYYKILFKPGVAVQARELTQLQSQIQNQIEKFGDHIFQNGTVVLGAERFFESDLISIKLNTAFSGVDVDLSLYLGKTIVGATSGTRAKVAEVSQYKSPTEPKTLIVKIISGTKFVAGENITWTEGVQSGTATIQASDAFANAMVFSINQGVFYIDGYFVVNAAQSIVVDAYSNTSTKSIGFNIVESIVDSDDDESLLDNAQGSPNYAAPGADRYSISLDLVCLPQAYDDASFLELAKVTGGELTSVNVRTIYSELEKELARRTYDESGNYTVRPFPISFKDHIGSAKARPVLSSGVVVGLSVTNGGVGYTSVPTVTIKGDGTGATATAIIDTNTASATYGQVTGFNITNGGTGYTLDNTSILISGDSNKFSIALDAGKAYVKGYEFETTNQSYLSVDRARTTESADNLDSLLEYGNFVNATNAFGVFDTSAYTAIELHDVARASVVGATSKIGSAKVRFLKYVSGTVGGAAAIYKISLFDIVIDSGKFFKNLESLVVRSGATVLAGYDLDLLSKVGGSAGGDAFLSGTDTNTLVFPLNNSYIKSLRDTGNLPQNDYTFQRTFNSVAFSAGIATIATNNGLERFFGGAGAYSDTVKDTYFHVVVTAVGTSAFTVGQVLRFNTGATRSITGGTVVPATVHQATLNVGANVGFTATIIATVNANTQSEKTKSLQNYTTKIISSPNTVLGNSDSIAVSDIYDVVAIYNTGNTNPTGQVTVNATTGAITSWGTVPTPTNVTANYKVDNGQRDEYYDHGSIKLIGTAPSGTNYLVIVYNYFTHTGNGFLGVGSYGIPYENIPTYTSPITGASYNLRDCIDFRPRRADGSTTLNNGQLPDPDFTFNSDYQYYVGRIDRVIATAGKSFIVKQGVPSTVPSVPSDEFDGMSLYVIEVPPYTANLSEISVKYIENKRYTMRDIGKLERRIENLEYYTQLSLLEKQAKDESITDSSNLEKFKNGLFVDGFTSNSSLYNTTNTGAWAKQIWGWWNFRNSSQNTWNKGSARLFESSISDSSNVDYHAAIDPFASELRAEFEVFNLGFTPSTFTDTVRNDDIVTLGYTEGLYISQQFASKSINVNPYNILTFNGKIKLNPPNDMWVETSILPAVNRVVDVQLPDAANVNIRKISGNSVGGRAATKITSSTTATVTSVIGLNTSSLGSAVVDLQYAPYIRAKTIYGFSSGFKPKSRLYPFIDNGPLSDYTRPNTKIVTNTQVGPLFSNLSSNSGEAELVSFRTGSVSGTIIGTAYVGYHSKESTTVAGQHDLYITKLVSGTVAGAQFVTGQNGNSASVTSITTYVNKDALLPDEFGNLSFVIDLPGGIYPTGDRTIRLIDNIDNSFDSSSSVGDTRYFTQGLLQSTQETILTTRSVRDQKVTTVTGYYYDPLAQSFLIDPRGNPDGIHISSVDLYFKFKSSTVPVTMEIRRTVNGTPESAITSIPFATVTLEPSDVNVSSTGDVPTNFKLPAPIHLVTGEYAIVVLANTQEYEVYVAEMGKTDVITNQIISKQPYTGVLFKSQNASTWTPVQEEDMKFRIHKANFGTSGSVEFGINDNDSFTISGTTTNASANITNTITSKLKVDDYVYGTGIPAGARVLSIGSATSFTMTVNATASATVTITAIPFFKYQTIHINSSNVVPTGADIVWSIKTLDDATSVMDAAFSDVILDIDSDATSLKAIKPKAQNGNVNSLILRADLRSSNGDVSPMIDVAGLSTIFAKNNINMTDISSSDGEQVSTGGDAKSKYITKKVTLADGFDASNIVVTLDGYKPSGTDIRVYYKISSTESSAPFETASWVRMKCFNVPPNSSSVDEYNEHKFFPVNAFDAYGVPANNPIAPRFNVVAIKVVLVSSNFAITPKIRDFRAICLDS
jgi:hypothetical protein